MNDGLIMSCPEALGIPSKAIANFLKRLEYKELPMHGFIILRHGKIAAEGYWAPFNAERKHRIYSSSKSVTSVAIGILQAEGKISISDPVIKYFPEYDTPDLHPFIRATTIRDLLRMSTHRDHSIESYTPADPDWTYNYFHSTPTHLPGKVFSYDTSATTLMCRIIQKVTGMEMVDYMREKFFIPAQMSDDIWCIQTPCGHDWGGSGVTCTLRDFAKFAMICMHGGRWQDRQLVPEDYMREATTKQIDTNISKAESETRYGYGYQFWISKNNGFYFSGMGGQNAYCLPDKDFVLAVMGDTQSRGSQGSLIMEAMWKELYPYLQDSPAAENAADIAELRERIAGLKLITAPGMPENAAKEAEFIGKTYRMQENRMGWKLCRFEKEGNALRLYYENATGAHELCFGMGCNVTQEFPETQYSGVKVDVPKGKGYECHASAAWTKAGSLITYCFLTDVAFGTLRMNFAFEGNTMTVFSNQSAEWFLKEYWGFAAGCAD